MTSNLSLQGLRSVWIDVEGFAFQVLSGADRLLTDPQTLILKVELEDNETWAGQVTAQQTSTLIESYGFVPVIVDIEYVGQFNAVYVRPDALAMEYLVLQRAFLQMYDLATSSPT